MDLDGGNIAEYVRVIDLATDQDRNEWNPILVVIEHRIHAGDARKSLLDRTLVRVSLGPDREERVFQENLAHHELDFLFLRRKRESRDAIIFLYGIREPVRREHDEPTHLATGKRCP